MQNDGTMYLRLSGNEICYPEEVFPFEYQKISLFSCESDGGWRVTDRKTGYRIGRYGTTQEDAENAAKSVILFQTPSRVRKLIKEAAKNIKDGLIYDNDSKEWEKPLE